jgi:hypothetical protein
MRIAILVLCGLGLLGALALHFMGHRVEASSLAGVTCVVAIAFVLVAKRG